MINLKGEFSQEFYLPELDLAMLALLMTVTPTTFSNLISSIRIGVEIVFLFKDFNLLT